MPPFPPSQLQVLYPYYKPETRVRRKGPPLLLLLHWQRLGPTAAGPALMPGKRHGGGRAGGQSGAVPTIGSSTSRVLCLQGCACAVQGLDLEGLLDCLSKAPAGSVVMLHACAHNPTGACSTVLYCTAAG